MNVNVCVFVSVGELFETKKRDSGEIFRKLKQAKLYTYAYTYRDKYELMVRRQFFRVNMILKFKIG